jgi:asparagine synthase (glutamine-hydrolysing)
MCGIVGVVAPVRSGRAVPEDLILRMRESLQHRGPDQAGVFLAGGIGLGHRRLSIVDVAHGQQPMHSPDRRHVVVYNGEVFNHPQLQAELESSGVRYESRCDTETVLHLVSRLGVEGVKRLRGMFAIALWDAEARTLTLARDRFGVKPLYYCQIEDGSLVFGSEIKALLASGLVRAALNASVLPDFLANHAPSGEETFFAGVQRLPAGHFLVWRDGVVRVERYWDLPLPDDSLAGRTDASLTEEYLERLREAVRLRLMADVPLGAFLSGGIDSAAITALMAELVDGPIKTFSVAFAEREANELEYARLVATTFKTDHHELLLEPVTFFDRLPRLTWHEDEPIAHPSSIALNAVSELASRHVKVVLTGEGSDELLAGYNRYRVTLGNLRAGAYYESVIPTAVRKSLASAIGRYAGRNNVIRKVSRTFLGRSTRLADLYFDNFAVFNREQQQALLTPALREQVGSLDPYRAIQAVMEHRGLTDLLDRLLYADANTYLQELLMKQDQMSMAASIESRVPFLDHPLAEFTMRLPQRMKLRGAETKVILRRAMADILPGAILERRKMGFPVPIAAWLRGEYRHVLDEFVLGERAHARGQFNTLALRRMVAEHVAGQGGHWERLWLLVNFEVWQRLFIDGEDEQSIRRQLSAGRGIA